MKINDPIERIVAEVLLNKGIKFIHEMENKAQGLDFYLPEYDIFIECKAYSTPRTEKQIEDKKVILIQTSEAAKAFVEICLKSNYKEAV
jgi:hypothetical protein